MSTDRYAAVMEDDAGDITYGPWETQDEAEDRADAMRGAYSVTRALVVKDTQ